MPLRKSIPNLTDASTNAVSKWLFSCAKKWPGVKARQLQREYVFRVVNPHMRQHLLATAMALSMYAMPMDNKILMLELLGDGTTNSLDLSGTGYLYVDEVFNLYRAITSSLGVNLTNLNIVCLIKGQTDLKFVKEINAVFYYTMEKLKNLTTIVLKGLGETEMLTVIGKTCPHLEHLDVSQSLLLCDESIASLLTNQSESLVSLWEGQSEKFTARFYPCCHRLKFLGISGTEISSQVVYTLLQLLPNLESFGGYLHHASMCYAISYLYGGNRLPHQDKILKLNVYHVEKTGMYQLCLSDCQNSDSLKQSEKGPNDGSETEGVLVSLPGQLSLTHLWDVQISQDQCNVLKEVCPQVFSVDTNLSSIDFICNLNSLTELSIDCDFRPWAETVSWYLENFGAFLTSVSVGDAIEGFLPLHYLKRWCPNMKSVSVPIDNSMQPDDEMGKPWESVTYINTVVPNIKTIYLLCCVAVNLKELYLNFSPPIYTETKSDFNDDVIIDIFRGSPLHFLEVFIVGHCCLGGRALEAVCASCSSLRTIGYIDLWSELKESHLENIKKLSKENNWNLSLLRSTDFSGDKLHFTL